MLYLFQVYALVIMLVALPVLALCMAAGLSMLLLGAGRSLIRSVGNLFAIRTEFLKEWSHQ
jgi:hypothetical protein